MTPKPLHLKITPPPPPPTRTVRYEVLDDRRRDADWTLVQDGTACGEKLICMNQTCESIYPYIEPGQCKTNNNALECSGHGVSREV